MIDFLLHYGVSLLDAILTLLAIGIAIVISYLYLRRQERTRLSLLIQDKEQLVAELSDTKHRVTSLEKLLEQTRQEYDSVRFKAFYNDLLSTVGHEFEREVEFIRKTSQEVWEGLKDKPALAREQILILTDKQERILTNCYELLQHAENILGYLSPQRGKLQVIKLKNEVNEVAKELYLYGEAKRVTIQLDFPDIDLDPITINRTSARQILMNVLHNAIKYSLRDSVVNVKLYLDESDVGERTLCVEVKDTGIGIAEKDQQKIFEIGIRADGLIEPGNGVGLPFARESAQSYGGDVVLLASAPNQGSTFKIVFPYQ